MFPINKYKTIFLDWNGTLSKSKFWGQLGNGDETERAMFAQIEEALFGQMRELLKPWMRGEYTSEDICRKIADGTGLAYEVIFAEFVKSCELMELSDGKIPDLLKNLKETGAKIVIATDNMDSFTRWTYPSLQKRYGDLFYGFLNSADISAMKEDMGGETSLFFDKYIKENNLSCKDSVLIDNSPDKNGVFKKIGLEYIQVPTTEDFLNVLFTSNPQGI